MPWPIKILLLTMCITFFCLQFIHFIMATSSRIMHHVTKHKLSQPGSINMTRSSVYLNGLHSHRSESNRAHLGCGRKGDLEHECAADKSDMCEYNTSRWTKISKECFALRNTCQEELCLFWEHGWVLACINMMFLIKLPVLNLHLNFSYCSTPNRCTWHTSGTERHPQKGQVKK